MRFNDKKGGTALCAVRIAGACLLFAVVCLVFVTASSCRTVLAPTLSAIYDQSPTTENYAFDRTNQADPYLRLLREEFALDAVVAGAADDLERAEKICGWVHSRWDHVSAHAAAPNDPVSILRAAANGERFRCVEYGIVVSGCLNAIGIKSRVVGLKTKDIATRASGAGHVVAEAWLPDQGKWIFLDGQEGIVPLGGGGALSGVEFMAALYRGESGLDLWAYHEGYDTAKYYDWISDYLYFYGIALDQRIGDAISDRNDTMLMLVPLGEKNPAISERHYYFGDHYLYTNSATAFYAAP